ncbi:MAG TPA: tetratricopeptide repeat protein, partial [Myxococcales bacterium]|nr:tetratricopeptide repeat protein [Myxococcales bacterium]
LGIAYKEMGLVDEAVAEFELAVLHGSGGPRAPDCMLMLGICEAERGNTAEAVKRFQAGLGLPGLAIEPRKALYFELGTAFETLQRRSEAIEQYQAVERVDPKYRDVQARITRLGGTIRTQASQPPRQQAPRTTPSSVPKAAAKATAPPPAAGGAPTAPQQPAPGGKTEASTDASAEAARKARKIGFV